VPNGIGPEHFAAADPARVEHARATLHLRPGPLVGTVARLSPEKRVDLLLEAAAHVRQRLPSVQFALVGDGPARGSLERLAHDLGLGHSVHFLGARDDVALLNRLWDVFVLPSGEEACPLALLEAMAAGRAVVAAAAGGSAEIVQHNLDGWLAAPDDPGALARAIVDLLANAPARRELGAAAQDKVARVASRARMVEQTLAIYRRLVG
jgi:glycosyltransferase involved in cell wall biosynthesis